MGLVVVDVVVWDIGDLDGLSTVGTITSILEEGFFKVKKLTALSVS